VNIFEKEIEIKFRVDDKLGSRIKNLDLKPHEETDEYFFSTENVGKDLYLRFRKKKGKIILTLKNVIVGGHNIGIYESEETSVELTEEQYQEMKKIFDIVFPIKIQVKKIRKKGNYKDCEICHDIVEGLGEFFEIEGSREKINELRKEFEIDDDLIDREKGYVVMLLNRRGLL